MAKDLIPFADIVSNNGPLEALGSAIRKAAAPSNKFTGKNTFKATVLRPVQFGRVNTQAQQNMYGIEPGAQGQSAGSRAYYVKVEEDHPHSFLPDPCFQGTPGALGIGANKIRQAAYTTALYSGPLNIKPGDDVLVAFDHKDFSYDTDICRIVEKIGSNINNAKRKLYSCTSPGSAFNMGGLGSVGYGAGGGSYSSDGTGGLLGFIASGEGGYNSMNNGTDANSIVQSTHDASEYLGKNLTDMTIGEVMAAQNSKPRKLFAAGRYQIIPKTMRNYAFPESGLKTTDMFSPENQDKLGRSLLFGSKRKDLAAYLSGRSDNLRAAHIAFALEWASVPHPDTGLSAYWESGNRALHTVEQVQRALIEERHAWRENSESDPSDSDYSWDHQDNESDAYDVPVDEDDYGDSDDGFSDAGEDPLGESDSGYGY
tara:strand:+ start:2437 stop:3717 length:1281 start_codon:yes stop_codon:yes gene_type:complete